MLGLARRDWIAVAVGLAVLAGFAVGIPAIGRAFWAEAVSTIILINGKGGGCSWKEIRRALHAGNEIHERVAEYNAKSVLLAEERTGLRCWRTTKGDFWTTSSDPKWLTMLVAEQEEGIYSADGHGVRPLDVVLDCGANIGVYSRVALEAGARKVVAIEPEPQNVECLRRNLVREIADGRVILVSKGVWQKEDFLEIQINDTNPGAHSFVRDRNGGGHKIRVPLTTIDNLVAELRLERVDYIKMDIEGAERNALAGAKDTLRRFHPRLAISVYHLPDDPTVVDERVREAWPGYHRFLGSCTAGRESAGPQVFFYE